MKKKIIQLTILVITLALMFYYIVNNFPTFKQNILTINPLYFIPIFLLFFIGTVLTGLITKYLLEAFKIKLRAKEWFGLAITTNLYNMLTPFRGGLMAKAAYLKRKHKFSYTNFVSALSGIYLINFLVASFLGLISVYLIYTKKQIFSLPIFIGLLGVFLVTLAIILFAPKFKENKYKILNLFVRVINGWNEVKTNKKTILKTGIVMFIQLFFSSLTTLLVYYTIGIKLGFYEALFITSIGLIVSFFSITPSGLGITEAVAVFSALIINIEPTQSLTVAIIQRIVNTVYTFIIGPIFVYKLLKK